MKLLSKLNGWQRLWLIVTVNLQLAGGVSRFFRGGAIERYLEGPLKCKTNTGYISPYLPNMPTCQHALVIIGMLASALLLALSPNAYGLFLCLTVYAFAHLSVILLRWVISGFKKSN